MGFIKKGNWVVIRDNVLEKEQRSPNIPEVTREFPLKMWVKGTLLEDSLMGEMAEVETVTGRRVSGILEEVNPTYTISFGDYIPELAKIGKDAKRELMEAIKNEQL